MIYQQELKKIRQPAHVPWENLNIVFHLNFVMRKAEVDYLEE